MKFENVKVGDTVFTQRQVSYGWNSAETFYIPEKVIRVTKTQFTVECGDRYKKEGNKIGDSWTKAHFDGDNVGWGSKEVLVCDDSHKMNEFKRKLVAERKFDEIAEKLKVGRNSNLNIVELDELVKKLEKISNYIKSKKDEA